MINEYRNFDIDYDTATGQHIARSRDDGFHMISRSLSRIIKATDQMWEMLKLSPRLEPIIDIDAAPLPGWLRKWLKSNCVPDRIDLDREFAAGQL
jgi:hypothetical protein